MKNKYIQYLCGIVVVLVVGLFVELLFFNFRVIFLNETVDLTDKISYSSNDNGDTNLFLRDLGQYINKLKIYYQSEENVKVEIKYTEDDYYGENKKSVFEDTFNSKLDQMVINFQNEVDDIKLSFEKDVVIEKVIIDNQINFNLFRYVYVVSFIFILWILFHYYKKRFLLDEIYRVFFILAVFLGSLIIFFQPNTAQYSWDEQIHFSRTYKLLKPTVRWTEDARMMLETFAFYDINSIEEQYDESKYLNASDEVVLEEDGQLFIKYDEVGYIFLSLGFNVGDILGLPFSFSFKFGKFLNLVAYSLIIAFAINKAKTGKRLLAVIGLLPTCIFTACQYSYDGAVISGLILGVVYLFNAILYKDIKIDFKFMIIFLLAMLYASFVKAVYAPIMLLFLLIPKDRFKNKKIAIYSKFCVCVICLLVMSTFVLPAITSNAFVDARGGDTSVTEQLKLILTHPIGYMNVLKNTMLSRFIGEFIGIGAIGMYSYLGYISNNLYMLSLLCLIFVAITDVSKHEFSKINRSIIFVFILGVILLVWTALYLSFTPVGENTINGVQPRYFLPLLFPMIICLQSNKIKCNIKESVYNYLVLLVPSIILLISIYQIFLKTFCM